MSYNPFSLEGKTILVTGASSGIGRAVAIECSKMGAIVIITGRNPERLAETFSELSGQYANQQIIADLTINDDLEKLVLALPSLNGIVHCAAIIKKLPLKFITEKALEEIIHANLTAPAILTQKLIRKNLLQKKGSIIFISSIASKVASLGNIMYMASKGAINSLARGMALELAEKGIRVNCIEPALIRTNLTNVLTEQDLENYEKKFPLGRFGKPEEVAYAAIYLLSDATEWVTGSIITIDGGITLR
jgi:NAD(P)-dependent dehydrogenase (short-subunit alcohol dehydrogenase family)